MKVVIAGGSGALGRRLSDDLASRGDEVVILTRSPRRNVAHRQLEWDGHTVGTWATELGGAIVVNLAGELVDRRPTARNIALLRSSRVEATRVLVAAASQLARPPALWLQMSTLAIYGDAGQDLVDETHPVADGPPQMAGVARPWEEAVRGAAAGRLVIMRTGIVLDHGTPAFDRLSWIHADDFLRAIGFLRGLSDLDGVVHLTAPNPIQNRDMMRSLRRALRRPWSPPTTTPLVRLGAVLMRTDPALALTGRRCVPRRLLDAGFDFEHPTFDDALTDLAKRAPA